MRRMGGKVGMVSNDEALMLKAYSALSYALGLCEGANLKNLDWLCEAIDDLEKRLIGDSE